MLAPQTLFFFLFFLILVILDPLHFHLNFSLSVELKLNQLISFYQKILWDYGWDFIKSIDQFILFLVLLFYIKSSCCTHSSAFDSSCFIVNHGDFSYSPVVSILVCCVLSSGCTLNSFSLL